MLDKLKPNLFAFTKEGKDPLEIKLCLSDKDRKQYSKIPRQRGVKPITVTDEATGKKWSIRPTDCGLACYCACLAVPVK